jgi:putative redox protein
VTGRSERIVFPSAQGHDLAARLDLPEGVPVAYALFAHCFTCSKDVFAASRIAAALAERGIAVLRFDFTGLGASEGEFANTDFTSNVADLRAAADWLARAHQAPALLIGHSLGGAAALKAAPDLPAVRAVVTVNAPCGPSHLKALLADSLTTIRAKGEAMVDIGGRPFLLRRAFLDDIEETGLLDGVARMRKALLLFHAPLDAVVGVENARRIFQAAHHPKSFVSLDDADHLLTRREDATYVADVVAAWATRYLGAGHTLLPRLADKPLDRGTVLVVESGRNSRFAQEVVAGRHHLRADEPVDVGGSDTGPSPYETLLMALGACTSMTIRMYADHKTIPLDRVAVRLRHNKIHAEDCADCETDTGKVDVIAREIELVGDLDPATRARLLEIADRCPVHRTLKSEIVITTREAAGTGTGAGGSQDDGGGVVAVAGNGTGGGQ